MTTIETSLYEYPFYLPKHKPKYSIPTIHREKELGEYYLELNFRLDRLFYMITKRKYVMANRFGNTPMPKFVNYFMNSADEAKFMKWYQGLDKNFSEDLFDIMRIGYKVSFSYKPEEDSTSVTFSPANDKQMNYGYLLSSFADDRELAFYLNVYKSEYLADNGNWESLSQAKRKFG